MHNKKLEVLYEDEDILAIQKQAGLIVNRSDTTTGETTVQDMVDTYLGLTPYYSKIVVRQGEWKENSEVFKERSGIVHRLDKETSGVLLVAKTLESFTHLQRQFKEREVHKTYIALAHGKLTSLVGEINAPVGRLVFNRKRFGVIAGGREAITNYIVLKQYMNPKTKEYLSLLELQPKTGRTHQIRVHLKHLQRPIFSDELYAGRKTARHDRKELPRLFLHAAKLSFTHPITLKKMEIESSLPRDLIEFLNQLVL